MGPQLTVVLCVPSSLWSSVSPSVKGLCLEHRAEGGWEESRSAQDPAGRTQDRSQSPRSCRLPGECRQAISLIWDFNFPWFHNRNDQLVFSPKSGSVLSPERPSVNLGFAGRDPGRETLMDRAWSFPAVLGEGSFLTELISWDAELPGITHEVGIIIIILTFR